MSNITNKTIKDGVVIISTEGYFNKDLGEALKELTDDEIKNGHKNFLINLICYDKTFSGSTQNYKI